MRCTALRSFLLLLALTAAVALLGAPADAADKDDAGFVKLFNGTDFTGFKFEVGKAAAGKDLVGQGRRHHLHRQTRRLFLHRQIV